MFFLYLIEIIVIIIQYFHIFHIIPNPEQSYDIVRNTTNGDECIEGPLTNRGFL